MAAEIRSNASYCEKYQKMEKLPCAKEGTLAIKTLNCGDMQQKEKLYLLQNSKHVSLQHLNATVVFDQFRDKFKNFLKYRKVSYIHKIILTP